MFQRSSREIMPYVVGLFSHGGGLGTGTIISPKGLILTADHVLTGASGEVTVCRNFVGRVGECFNLRYQSVARFPEHDLALIHIPSLPLDDVETPIRWRFSGLWYGSPVGSFGYPHSQFEWSVAQHSPPLLSVTMILRFKSYFISGFSPDPPSKTYSLDSFAYGGHSGGPVFDIEGRVFGVMVRANLDRARSYEVSFCEVVALSNIQSELVNIQRNAL